MHSSPTPREPFLSRLGRSAARRRRAVLAAWVVVLAAAIVGGPAVAGDWSVDYSTPGSDSRAVSDAVARAFPQATTDSLLVTWFAPGGADAGHATSHVRRALTQLSELSDLRGAGSLAMARYSTDRRYGFLEVPMQRAAATVAMANGPRLVEIADHASADGVTIRFGGQVMTEAERGAIASEGIGVAVALVILLLSFGTIVAAGLPLATALFGVGTAGALVGVVASIVDTPDWASSVAMMVGIGVGIDYALLILTRYRAARHAGAGSDDAIAYAMGTAGRSVVVAGTTVVISMLGLLLMGLPYLVGVAFAACASVLTVMVAAITLLPALLGFAGDTIERLRVPRPGKPRATAVAGDDATGADEHSPRFAAWSRAVQRRPLIATVAGVAILGVIAAPVAGVQLGFPGHANDPAGTQAREANDLMTAGFGPGIGTPLQLVVRFDSATLGPQVNRLRDRLAADRRVAHVVPLQRSRDGQLGLVQVQSRTSPDSRASIELLNAIRDQYVPASGLPVKVGGWTAMTRDQAVATADRLPLLFLGVAGLSSLLLLAAFRSLLVPLKAAAMNLLSIIAAYGVVAAVAEGGALGQLFGIDSEVPIPPFIPVLMFAVLFGLSMDYEVFLVGRIREAWAEHGDASRAITDGISATARVITAAAAIMIAVFGAFAFDDQVFLQLIGIGMASAILIDATVIRLFLVPALMELMGRRAWWLPTWVDRWLPRADLDANVRLPRPHQAAEATTRNDQSAA